MLVELRVSNFAIIDSVHISFKEGLNILSGETGAGKSVLLKSLALLMGEKALADTVRTGADSAVIEGVFELGDRADILELMQELGVTNEDGQLVVRRVVSTQGKSRVYLNGGLFPVTTLRDLVSPLIEVTGQSVPLIEMTGQHENRNLQSTSYHLDLLDFYTNSWPIRTKVGEQYARLSEIDGDIEIIQSEARTREQRLDFLIFQRDEIKALGLQPGQEEDLENKVSRLKNAKRLSEFVKDAEYALYSADDSALVRIHAIVQKAQELSAYDESLIKKMDGLVQAKAAIEECVYDLRGYERELTDDPAELDDSEEKLSQLRKLQKKHGQTVQEILATYKKIVDEIESLETSDERLKQLQLERKEVESRYRKLSDDLHVRRTNGAKLLAKAVNEELQDLNMKGVVFEVHVTPSDVEMATGLSNVEFMIRASKNDTPRALAKFASGGELSRILLSLKRVVGHSDQPRTYLFDEVDTGVSGQTAEKVGRKLRSIAKGQQVICVTHLPQVASFADTHFLIQKAPQKRGVHMTVVELTPAERVKEIARLISGEKITKTSLEHAKELLQMH